MRTRICSHVVLLCTLILVFGCHSSPPVVIQDPAPPPLPPQQNSVSFKTEVEIQDPEKQSVRLDITFGLSGQVGTPRVGSSVRFLGQGETHMVYSGVSKLTLVATNGQGRVEASSSTSSGEIRYYGDVLVAGLWVYNGSNCVVAEYDITWFMPARTKWTQKRRTEGAVIFPAGIWRLEQQNRKESQPPPGN